MTNVPYDTIASWYDEYAVHTPFHQEMVIPSLVSLVGEIAGQTVCDVACGQGIVSRELARRGARVTGVDISAALLDLARDYEARASLGIRYVEDNAEHLRTVADASVDGATCCMALMNVTDLAACMAAVNRGYVPVAGSSRRSSTPAFRPRGAAGSSIPRGGPLDRWATTSRSASGNPITPTAFVDGSASTTGR